MKINIAQIVGFNTDQRAAQVLSQQAEEEVFLAVLNLSSDDAFTKGRLTLSELSDFYFDAEGGASEKLSSSFEEALKKLAGGGSFDLVLGAISGKALYLIGKGEVEVYLNRLDKLSPLLSIGSEKQIISGFLQEGDKILLSTKSLVNFLGEDLEKYLGLSLDLFKEEVSSKIEARPLPDSKVSGPEEENDQPEKAEGDESAKEDTEETMQAEEVSEEEEEPVSSPAAAEGFAALAISLGSETEPAVAAGINLDEAIPSLPRENAQPIEPAGYQYGQESSSASRNLLLLPAALIGKIISLFPKSGRSRFILAIILLLIIGLGIGYKYKSSKDKERLIQFNQDLQSAKDDFTAAKGLSSLTPVDAKAKLDSAKSKVSAALALEPKNQEAKDLQKQIEDESSSILQQSQAKEFPVFLDLDLIKKNFRPYQMSLSSGKLLVLDPALKTLISIDLAKKSNQIQAGSEQLGDAVNASLNGDLGFIYSKDKGILRVDITNQKVTGVAKTDKDWGAVIDLYGFGSNVYLLDSGKNQIWKYLPTSDGYSDKKEYLTSGTKADFSNSLRMQIESSVYILKKGGEILRFTRGAKDNFSLGGLDKGVKDPKSLFVSSDTDNLYLLDSGNSRLLILTKTGEYKGQISGDKFATASDLVVDEKGKIVYLLDGSKIYTVDLK